MKNLRKKNPLLQQFKDQSRQSVDQWLAMDTPARLDLCIQFLLLPVIQKSKPISQEMMQAMMPAAVDLERQATTLVQETPTNFQTIHDLLGQVTALFLMPES